jgi:hypothetical protein
MREDISQKEISENRCKLLVACKMYTDARS